MRIYNQVTGDQPSPGFGTAGRWRVTRTGQGGNLVTRHTSEMPGGTSYASPHSIPGLFSGTRVTRPSGRSAFTMIEIAITLAIIGIALVAIIGVLPIGINVQKDNREETVIDQDASVFLENIRNGARGLDDLTNYVMTISNSWVLYRDGTPGLFGYNSYNYTNATAYGATVPSMALTNGANIIGLLSMPQYINPISGAPILYPTNSYISNYVVAYVRSLSGPAVEKPPQDNGIIRGDAFSYKLICQNVPVSVDTNIVTPYSRQLTANLRELRLTFLWPLLPNGSTGNGRQTFRTTVAGQIMPINNDPNGKEINSLYFFQPGSFAAAP
jgi:prepilin-type N-terminal cleavage/methylation domain-containing protein